jgi:hypothetical protein
MAKVQGKKAATSPKKGAAAKPASRPKNAKPAPKKGAAKVVAKAKAAVKKAVKAVTPKKAAPKKAVPKKAVPKKAAAKKPAAKPAPKKAAAKPAAKPSPKKAAKPAPKPAAKPAPKAAAPAPEKPAQSKVKAAAKTVAKVAGAVAATAAAATVVRAVTPPADEKKRRRTRTRVTSNGPATAAWFSQGDRPRSSSFIPAPPRAEAPSLVAAPPASSDRLVGSHELLEFVVRTVPVRVDVEAGGGRIYLSINPNETTLRVGEGIEWDFRYLGGADVMIDELVIEFGRPSPFNNVVFRSRRPGAARPHRQMSGPAQPAASGKRVQYTIRAFNAFKTEMATAKPALTVA